MNLNSNVFFKSALAKHGAFISTSEVISWLSDQNEKVHVKVKMTSFDKLDSWCYKNGSIKHVSGKFFSIDGIKIKTNWGLVNEWQQPIINQPEIGYLGFITKEFNGILHFLVQAKIEPGNVNYVQLSPTLQATKSNYSQVHKGKKPLYLDYFQNAKPEQIILDQLQSEQGARFLKKRNRNIIIKVDSEITVFDNFIWLTLGQLKNLMQYDNCVNMDTRTVISGISYGPNFENDFEKIIKPNDYFEDDIKLGFLNSAISLKNSFNSFDNIIAFLTNIKAEHDLDVSKVPLKKMKSWFFNSDEIYHEQRKFFSVIAVDVEIGNREVLCWSQPMIKPAQEGLCAFVCKEINGQVHFAVQAKLECGNHDIIEFAPTVQCLTGNYRQTQEGALPFLEYVLNAKQNQIIFDTMQSEEGGRFYREQNRNMIIMAGQEISNLLPDKYIWITLSQILFFLKFNNYLNIQARSLIAAVSFV